MLAMSHSSRSAACSETLRSIDIAELEVRMGQNPIQGRALPQQKKGLGAYEERQVQYQSTLRTSRMVKLTEI